MGMRMRMQVQVWVKDRKFAYMRDYFSRTYSMHLSYRNAGPASAPCRMRQLSPSYLHSHSHSQGKSLRMLEACILHVYSYSTKESCMPHARLLKFKGNMSCNQR